MFFVCTKYHYWTKINKLQWAEIDCHYLYNMEVYFHGNCSKIELMAFLYISWLPLLLNNILIRRSSLNKNTNMDVDNTYISNICALTFIQYSKLQNLFFSANMIFIILIRHSKYICLGLVPPYHIFCT